jgi:hypothetical protein
MAYNVFYDKLGRFTCCDPSLLTRKPLNQSQVVLTNTYPLDCGTHQILDLDTDEYGRYIALLSNTEVWTNAWKVHLPYSFEHPFIRELDKERFLIVEARQPVAHNGHIFATTGHRLGSFDAGDGIADVLIQAGCIVISYFDEGVLGGDGPGSDGLAVFDFTGQQVFGFNTSQPHFILDCYCMCRKGQDSILAYTYTGFPLWEICLTDFQVSQQATPRDFEGANALTTFKGGLIFYSSYANKTSFFWWDRKEHVRRFFFTETSMRGIGNGKFLTHNATSFTILDAGEML